MTAAFLGMLAVLALSFSASAQSHPPHHHSEMPDTTAADEQKPEKETRSEHEHEAEAEAAPEEPVDPHAGHDMSGSAEAESTEAAATEPPPAPPADDAADHLFSPAEMEAARAQLRREHGGSRLGMIIVNLAEYQIRSRRDGFRWDGEGWFGGDINRIVLKSEGEGAVGDDVDDAEVQLVYSRAISPYFDLQGGIRYDFEPDPSRTYGTIGFEGLAPYWFEVEGALFVSERADVLARLEGYYDQPITQRLIVQPRAELNLAAQDVPENGIGSGLSDVEVGLRLRYEIRREIAPYLGVSWQHKVGDTAKFARREGERVTSTSFLLGMRVWF
jgi:copper resistance protein B